MTSLITAHESEKEEQKLLLAHLHRGGPNDFKIEADNNDWRFSLDLDTETEELIFNVDVSVRKWLAVGFADDLQDADIIFWGSGIKGPNDELLGIDSKVGGKYEESMVYDKVTLNGVLLDTPDNHLRNVV